MRSKLGFLLPSIFKGNQALEKYLQALDKVFFDIQQKLQDFPEQLLPDNAPADWLYWLFWVLGAENYYRNDFTEAEKRKVLKNLFALFTGKGTIEGIKKHINTLSRGETAYIYNAPSKSFLSASLTQEEREQYESNFREIRLYPEWKTGQKGTMFTGDFLIECFPAATDAPSRLYGRATVFDPLTNEEEELNTFSGVFSNLVEIHKRGVAYGTFPGSAFTDSVYLYPQGSEKRLYVVALEGLAQDALQFRKSLGLQPVRTTSIYYRERYIPGTTRGIYPETILYKKYTVPSTAKYRIQRYFRIFEEDRVIYSKRATSCFIGQRIGAIPPFNVELGVKLIRQASAFEANTRSFLYKRFFYKSDAKERIERARWAVNLARAAGIKIIMDTSATSPATSRRTVRAGQYICGQHVGGA